MKQWVDTRRDQSYHPHSTRNRTYHPNRHNPDLNYSSCTDDVRIRPRERNRRQTNGAVDRVVYAYNSSDSCSERSASDDRDHGTPRRNPQRYPTIINRGFSTNDRNRRHSNRQRNASRNSSDSFSTPRDDASCCRCPSGERERRRHFNRWWRSFDNHNRHQHLQ